MKTFSWKKFLWLAMLCGIMGSCVSTKPLAINGFTALMENSEWLIEQETNWDILRAALPSQLKQLQLIQHERPCHEPLLTALVSGFQLYGFAIQETELWETKFDPDSAKWRISDTLQTYQRSIAFAEKWFACENLTVENTAAIEAHVKEKFQRLALLSYAQALLASTRWNPLDRTLLAQVPNAEKFLQIACKQPDQLPPQTCELGLAFMLAVKPSILGGNATKAHQLFQKILAQPISAKMFAYALHTEGVLLPLQNEKQFLAYASQAANMMPSNIFDAIGKKRLELIYKYRKNYF